LKDFEFTNIAHKAVTDLTNLFADYRKKDHSFIYLGHFGIIDYGFGRAVMELKPISTDPSTIWLTFPLP
jgi:hypothetical protein